MWSQGRRDTDGAFQGCSSLLSYGKSDARKAKRQLPGHAPSWPKPGREPPPPPPSDKAGIPTVNSHS